MAECEEWWGHLQRWQISRVGWQSKAGVQLLKYELQRGKVHKAGFETWYASRAGSSNSKVMCTERQHMTALTGMRQLVNACQAVSLLLKLPILASHV